MDGDRADLHSMLVVFVLAVFLIVFLEGKPESHSQLDADRKLLLFSIETIE